MNLIIATDSYKVSHHKIYPEGLEEVYSYFESREDRALGEEIVFFGLDAIIRKHLTTPITRQDIDEAEEFFIEHFGRSDVFNRKGWEEIVSRYGGLIPVRIRAVPEGTVLPSRTPLFTVENTGPAWVTNYIETLLSHVWYPITVATNSRNIKKLIRGYYGTTSTEDPGGADFKVQDFGFRGVSCYEQAEIGGAAHLISFKGTDTMPAIGFLQRYYRVQSMPGYSIPATEHSNMTLEGREGEVQAMRRMLEQFPDGLIACVSDSYDILNAVRNLWGTELKDLILGRNGTLVIRPDSGDPVYTTLQVVQVLWEVFGGTINAKGYKVLDSHVRMIQGDGINYDMIGRILSNFAQHGFSVDNIAFGSGGALLQKFDRDTLSFAFKCSHAVVNGKPVDVRKDPMEFDYKGNYRKSFKASKAGKFSFVQDIHGNNVVLNTVYDSAQVFHKQALEDIRRRAAV